jgi:putative ubiquitin-RnfH superfamily antitoxin RatB of RatAB toxin-antitoxin module
LNDTPLQVEVAYAEPARVIIKALRLASGSSAADALRLAAGDTDFAGVDLAGANIGIFGKVISRDQVLQEGDRLEIYRPLAADPKAARRARAEAARSTDRAASTSCRS